MHPLSLSQIKPSPAEKAYPMRLVYACIVAGLLGLSGCATHSAGAGNSADNESQASSVVESGQQTESTPQNEGLTAEFVYRYLIGEIAGQRGDFATSGSIFFDLARKTGDSRLAERAARTAAYGNVTSLAVPAVKLWAELDPTSNDAQQAMTEMLIATGKVQEAEPFLAKLLAKEDTRAAGFLYINTILSRSPDKAGVLKIVQSLAKPYPQLAEAHFAVAQAAWSANQDDLALQALNKAESLKPGWHVAALFKGQVLFGKSPKEAISYYQNFLSKHPDANEVRVNLAKVLVTQKQYDLAKKEFPTIVKYAHASPAKNAAEITAVLGLLAVQGNDYATADSYFQESLKLGFKEEEQLYIYLGQVAEKLNRDDLAAAWYNKVQPGQRYLEAQLNLANVVTRTQSVEAAIAKLDVIDDLNTEQQILVIQSEAVLLGKVKRHQDAYELLEKAINNLPNTPELVYDYALAAERVKKLDLMESQLRKVIAAKPDFAAAYNALGYSFADRNIKLDEALSLIEKALTISPNDHYMLDSLGWVHYRKGNLEKAIGYLQQAYDINPDPEIAAHLGEVLWQKGRHDEAKRIWNDALIINPDNEVLVITANKFKS